MESAPHITAIRLCGNNVSVGTRDAQLLHAEVKCRSLDAQTCGRPVGAGDNPAGLFEGLANVVSLRVLQSNCSKGFRFGGTLQTRERGVQDFARSEDNASLDEILERPNVPWPLIRDKGRHRFRRNMFNLLIHPSGINLDKMCDQCRNVFPALPQRWQRDRKHIQTVVEVAAKFVALHHVTQIPVGRSDEPNVHLMSPSAAQAFELLFLQDTQQFGLQAWWNIAHLVQEQRPFVGQFETANLLRYGSGERASLVAKKLAFQQIERNGRAIQFNEWASAPRAQIVNRACDQLLAGACFSQDKNGGIGRRDAFDLFEYRFQSRTVAYDLLESARIAVLVGRSESCSSCHGRPP